MPRRTMLPPNPRPNANLALWHDKFKPGIPHSASEKFLKGLRKRMSGRAEDERRMLPKGTTYSFKKKIKDEDGEDQEVTVIQARNRASRRGRG